MRRKISIMTVSRIINLVEKGKINLNVWYQRQAGKWDAKKQSEFIGDLLNDFSPGVLFYHRHTTGDDVLCQVDGKQRVSIILAFKNGTVRLPDPYLYEANPAINISGMSWVDLESKHPEVLKDLLAKEINAELLITDDLTKIFEQFVKLNSGKKLTTAEIRHAFPGELMKWIRDMSKHRFLVNKLGFGNRSYEYEDLLIKLLYMEVNGRPMNLHSKDLNIFAQQYVSPKRDELKGLRAAQRRVEDVLDSLDLVFHEKASIFSKPNYVPSAYWLIRDIINGMFDWTDANMREFFNQFADARHSHRKDKPFYRNAAHSHYNSLLVQGLIKEDGIRDRYTILYRFAEQFTDHGAIDINTNIFIDDLITYKNSELYIKQAVVV